jgi:serine/threonine-protein kinase
MDDSLRDRLQSALGAAYSLERELGGGGMSRVFVAEETRFHRRVVIKVLSPELAAGLSVERFEREIALAAGLQQANIVPVLAAGEVDGLPWYTMPYVEGESLRAELVRGPVPMAEAVAILRDVARALAYAHARGVVHRDIKPENILLSGGAAVVTDFGIAKAVAASKTQAPGGTLTAVGTSLGTPAYMSPEQAVGDEADHRADLYAWGVMAYELLAGRHPFAAKTTSQQLIAAHVTETPPSLDATAPAIPSALASLVMRALAKSPADRPQTAAELLASLGAIVTPAGESGRYATRPRRARRRVLLSLGFAVVAIAIVLSVRATRAQRHVGTTDAPGISHSIAVLPFENLGGDTAQAYFADGMTEEISGVLAKIPNLRVAGRRSAFAFRGKPVSASEIGQALGVALLLEGRVRRVGNQVRVTAELTNAADGSHRWSGKWQAEVKDAFQVQDSIAQAIAAELRLALGGTALAAARAGRTTHPEAHDRYLRARAHLGRGTEADLRRAIALFQEALAVDPRFAQAHTGIATAWAWLADVYVPAKDAYPRAREAALAALGIDSLLAEAHATYGYALITTERDLRAAEREMQKAVALDPNSYVSVFLYGNFLCGTGRTEEGLAYTARSLSLEPSFAIASWNRELCFYMARRWDDVLVQHRRTMELDSTLVYLDAFDAAALREKGQYAESVAAYESAQRTLGGQPLYGLAITYARMGRLDDARRVMGALEERIRREYLPPDALALGYAGIGDVNRAFPWLQRAVDMSSVLTMGALMWPDYESLRGDPRFQPILRQIGLR